MFYIEIGDLMKQTGWTREQVDALTISEFNEWRAIKDALHKANI